MGRRSEPLGPQRQRDPVAREPCPAIFHGHTRPIDIHRHRPEDRSPPGQVQLRGQRGRRRFRRDLGRGAGIVPQTMGGKGRRDRLAVLQRREHRGKPLCREHRTEERDGRTIGKAEPLVDMDLCAFRQLQRGRLVRVGDPGLQQQDAPFRHPARRRQVLMEPHPAAQRIGGGPVTHENARAAPRVDRACLRQIGQRASDRVPVHAKPFGQLRLGRQPVARRILPARDFLGDVVADRGPEGGTSHRCHQNFMRRPLVSTRGL